MIAPPIPVNEAARLAALREIGILDSLPESEYDAIVTLAAAVAGTPIAAISLVDDRRQWFKACIGLGNIRETARSVSFCGHAIVTRELLVVPDALQDARFADNPLVIGPPFIRYYAGLPLIDTQGHALGTLCVIDSSPRRLSQMQLDWLQQLAVLARGLIERQHRARELAHLTDYFEQLADDVFLFDAGTRRLIHANSRVLARFGHQPDPRGVNPASLSIEEIDAWQGLDEIRRRFDVLDASDDTSLTYRTDAFHPGGAEFPAEVRLTRINGHGGDTLCAKISDISERITHARELESLNASLEQRVRDRTNEVGATLEQIERLASCLAHDMRTPLHAIEGFADLLRRDLGASQPLVERYAERIVGAARRLQDMSGQLIGFLRGVSQPMQLEPLDMHDLVSRTWQDAVIAFAARDGVLRIDALPPARGDAVLVRQVLDNLISNGLKYARPDVRPEIHVLAIRDDDMNTYIVRDNGLGFPAEHADDLFRPFLRLHKQHATPGTGLGLTSVAHAVRRHGGRVWARPNADGGASFAFTLPAFDGARAAGVRGTAP